MISRRRFLTRYGAGAAGVLAGATGADLAAAGCTSHGRGHHSTTPSSPPPPPKPDPQLADLHAERELMALYDAAMNSQPALARTLRPIRADHAVHLAALHKLLGPAAGATSAGPSAATVSTSPPAATVSPSPPSSHRPSASASSGAGAGSPNSVGTGSVAPRLPGTRVALLAALRSAESAAAATRATSCYAATGSRAGLLGAISACESSHLVLL